MDFGKIIDRVKGILTTPRTEWPTAAAEPATIGGLYAGYIAIVAALPVIAGFIKGSFLGSSMFGITVRTPIGLGLAVALLHYALTLALAYVMALIINALASTFGGQKDMVQALKAVAYAWTASWIAGIAVIVPWLGWLVAIAGAVYAIYLLYVGLPHTMKCPPDKAGGYTVISIVIAIVLSWIISLVIAGVVGSAMLAGGAMSGLHVSTNNDSSVTFDSDSALGKLAAIGQRANEAGKQLEAAQKSGDSAAESAAMGKMVGAIAGNDANVESLPTDQIKAFLPESLGALKRSSVSAERNKAMGMQVSTATAEYSGTNGQHINLEITDTGTAKGLVALATAMAPEEDKQTDHGYEKTYADGDRMVHEQWDSQSRYGEYSLIIAKRFTVKADGQVDSIDQLKQAVGSVDLAKLASMKEAGVKSN
jgi:hypothetical protein